MALDSHEADLRATASQIMHTCLQSAFQEWAHRTSPAEWDDWQTQAPSTNTQWLSAVEHLQARAQKMIIEANDYRLWWFVRTHLIVEMRNAGIGRLKLPQDWGHCEVAKALVPDMSDCVPLWTKSAGNSLKTILKQWQHTEPLDNLTCFACLLGDSAIDKHITDEFRSASHAITKNEPG